MNRIATRTTITALTATAAIAFAGCGGTGDQTAQQKGSGFYNMTTLQNEIIRESTGRDQLASANCVDAGSQTVQCTAQDTAGTYIGLTLTISAKGDHFVITHIKPH